MSINRICTNKFILVLFSLAALIRVLYIIFFNTLGNDDLTYISIADNLLKHGFLSRDGVSPELHFPPGFPIYICFTKLFLGSYERIFNLTYLIVPLLTSLLWIIFVKRFFNSNSASIFSVYSFLYPAFFNISLFWQSTSEIVYTPIVWAGFYFLFLYFFENPKRIYIFCFNVLFCLSYLVRPEGIIFAFFSVPVVLIKEKKKITNFSVFLSLLVPWFIIVMPYMVYLYNHLHRITLSGKDAVLIDYFHRSNTSFPNFILRNIVSEIKFIFSPNYFNPLVLISLICVGNVIKDKNYRLKVIFLALIYFLASITIITSPNSRYLFATLPALLIISALSLSHIGEKYDISIGKIKIFMVIWLLFSLCLSLLRPDLRNTPYYYKRAAKYVLSNYGEGKIIMSRNSKVPFYSNSEMISFKEDSSNKPEFVFASNVFSQDMGSPPNEIEKRFINAVNNITFAETSYILVKTFKHKKFFLKIYKPENIDTEETKL